MMANNPNQTATTRGAIHDDIRASGTRHPVSGISPDPLA
jgi:hypothetical protein